MSLPASGAEVEALLAFFASRLAQKRIHLGSDGSTNLSSSGPVSYFPQFSSSPPIRGFSGIAAPPVDMPPLSHTAHLL